ncbi:nitroreductase family protein [Saccharothrix deserti]|uniref:nitroreductase family protein n=1 Tax=Saccharothrix deserti TaxID=2593674 RepID=UPI00131D0956|nr:nitroreductase family protein [Saccharothrix deserti]
MPHTLSDVDFPGFAAVPEPFATGGTPPRAVHWRRSPNRTATARAGGWTSSASTRRNSGGRWPAARARPVPDLTPLHAVQDVGPSPDWVRLREVLAADAEPELVPALVLVDQPVLGEYGQRGGLFGLLEAGAAAQSVCLRMAQQRLGGYLIGGAADADVLALLGLRGRPVRLAAVVAGGRTFTRR